MGISGELGDLTDCLAFSTSEESSTEENSDADLLNIGFRYAMALMHHREDAEDITQEAWLNLNRRYGKTPSKAALFTSIKNLVIDCESPILILEQVVTGNSKSLLEHEKDDLQSKFGAHFLKRCIFSKVHRKAFLFQR